MVVKKRKNNLINSGKRRGIRVQQAHFCSVIVHYELFKSQRDV